MALLSAPDAAFRDEFGDPVILRGCNLGNWLLLEMWMLNLGLADQHALEELLASRFGAAEKNRLMDVYRANFVTERDFDLLDDFGFNVVRLPFWHTLMEEDSAPFTLKPGAFEWLDRAIELARERGIHVILDMHGAPGGQGWEHHTGWGGRNLLWSDPVAQDRTAWLWGEIAARYRGERAVAAYDLLNEPWGGTEEQLRALAYRLHDAVRAEDPNHVVLLPAHLSGIWFYDAPAALGQTDVAFTHHFYPGLFGGSPTVEAHQQHFNDTLPWWDVMVGERNAPFLLGEMNVVHDSAGGGEMMRHHYDASAARGWATTMWSWKTLSPEGGAGTDVWHLATNPEDSFLVQATTWSCDGWNSSFADACSVHRTRFVSAGTGPVDAWVVVKAGACCGGSVDVTLDNLMLSAEGPEGNVLANPGFESAGGWTTWAASGSPTVQFATVAVPPAGASGRSLRITGADGTNGGVWQKVTLQGGVEYEIAGVFRDAGSPASSAWCEIYVGYTPPVPGSDYLNRTSARSLDANAASAAEFEAFFASLGTLPVVLDRENRYWLGDPAAHPDLIAPWPPVLRVPQAHDPMPAGWRTTDVGGARRGGQRRSDDGRVALYAAGSDIWGAADSFRFAWTEPGDAAFAIRTRVHSLRATHEYAKAGLMVRQSLAADSPHVAVHALPDGRVEMNVRASAGEATSSTVAGPLSFPIHLRISATGEGLQPAYSSDGIAWTPMAPAFVSAEGWLAGLTCLSHDPAAFTVAEFDEPVLSGSMSSVPLEEREGWSAWFEGVAVAADRHHVAPLPAGGARNAMRVHGRADAAGGVFLRVELQGGQSYRIDGVFRQIVAPVQGDVFAEVLLCDALPQDGEVPAGIVVARATSGTCAAWDAPFAVACAVASAGFSVAGTGMQTRYVALRVAGSGGAAPDVVFDEVRIAPADGAGDVWVGY